MRLNRISEKLGGLVNEFNDTFEENVNVICERHQQELSELYTLQRNYKRLLLRTGHTRKKVETALDSHKTKSVKKLITKQKKARFEELLKTQCYDKTAQKIEEKLKAQGR